MPRDFIPIIDPQSNLIRGGATVNGGQSVALMYRGANVEISDDGVGNMTARARSEFTRDATNSSDDATSSRGRGLYSFPPGQIRVDEDTFYIGTGTTTITGGNNFYADYLASFCIAEVSGERTLVNLNAGHTSTNASANHGNVWYLEESASAPTRISDADMPGNNGVSLARGCAYLDGYLFVMDINRQIHNSDINNITAWTASNFLTAQREPGYGMFLGKHHDNIVAFTSGGAIEFFYNAGNASGSPLAVRSDVSYRMKCPLPNTFVEREDIIYFLGAGADGVMAVYAIENFNLIKISNDLIDEALRHASTDIGDITGLTPASANYTLAFVDFIRMGPSLVLTTGTNTYTYSVKYGFWQLMSLNNDLTYKGPYFTTTPLLPIIGSNAPTFDRVMFTNGATATFANADGDSDITDLGESTAARSYIFSPPWDAGSSDRKIIDSIEVAAYPYATDTDTTAPFSLAWDDTDVSSAQGLTVTGDFTNARQIDLNTAQNNRFHRCGSCFQRVFKFQFDDQGMATVRGIWVNYRFA